MMRLSECGPSSAPWGSRAYLKLLETFNIEDELLSCGCLMYNGRVVTKCCDHARKEW